MARASTWVLLVLIPVTTLGQLTEDALNVICYWPKGATIEYSLQKGRRDTKNPAGFTFKGISTFEVLDSTQSSYTIRWDQTLDFSGLPLIGQNEVQEMVSTLSQLTLDYTTDENGSVIGFVDWDKTKERLLKTQERTLDLVYDQLSSKESLKKEDLAAAFNKVIGPFLEDPDRAFNYFFKEVSTYHSLFGVAFTLLDTQRADIQIPSPYGGAISGEFVLYVEQLDVESHEAVIVAILRPSSEGLKMLMDSFFDRLVKPEDRAKAKAEISESSFTSTETIKIRLDTRDCLFYSLDHSRVIRIGDSFREDWLKLELID